MYTGQARSVGCGTILLSMLVLKVLWHFEQGCIMYASKDRLPAILLDAS